MKKFFIILMLIVSSMLFSFNAFAQQKTTLRVGWSTPENHTYGIFAKRFKELTEKYTDGAVEVRLFPAGQLGSEDGAFKSIQMGAIDGYIITMSNLSIHYPLMDVFSLPYVFESLEHMQKVLKSDVAKDFYSQFEKTTGVALVTYGSMDTRDLYNTRRDINTFTDFSGLKYRVPRNEVMIETFRAFGAEPVPLAWSETPTALQTGTVDGGDNGTSVIRDMKFYEIAKHLTILDHFLAFSPLLISKRSIDRLDPEMKEAVYKAAAEANDYIDEYILNELENMRSYLAEKGMSITRPDRTEFIAAARNVQEHFAKIKGQEFRAFLEKISRVKP